MALNTFRKAQFKFFRLLEARAIFEWQSFYALRPLLKRFPKGDGHTVIVFPGFMSSDRATKPLRRFLSDLGYDARGWGLGTNMMFSQDLEAEMVALVTEAYEQSGDKVSLVGWSLGGLFAREVAKLCEDKVRGVVTLGSPISGVRGHSNASALFEALNGKPTAAEQQKYDALKLAPSVPTTSVYSKTDGIVAWEGSIQSSGRQVENIEVPASHLGMGFNAFALYVVADRLSQSKNEWKPFKIAGAKRAVYGYPSSRQLKALFG